jgi:hypothetical protein
MVRVRFDRLRVAVGAAIALSASPALAATPPTPTPATARLEGQFLLTGRVTVARGVRGEHRGQKVARTWTFTPGCAAGPCATIGLLRARAAGSDQLVLRRRAPAYYVGNGSFYAPLRCGRRTYVRGSAVPFRVTVRVTSAALAGSVVVATAVKATYTNRSRRNLTPCVAVLGHDSAAYSGHVVVPTGGAGTGG